MDVCYVLHNTLSLTIMINLIQTIFLAIAVFSTFGCAKKESPFKRVDNQVEDKKDPEVEVPPFHSTIKLFDGGTDGYHSFRIPALIKASNGTLIAFAEGRVSNNRDYGNINLVYKTSADNGLTWSALKEVVGVGPGTWGNPTAVVDESNGRIWLFLSWNSGDHNQSGTDGFERIDSWGDRKVYVTYSDDHGNSWSPQQDLTSTLLPSGYTWDAMGPGVGIQKTKAGATGRLIIPAIGRNIYSDDHGQTWQYQLLPTGTSEGTIAESVYGGLIRNDRAVSSQWNLSKTRRTSTGTINTFSSWVAADALPDPACQASMMRYSDNRSRIIFLNSASTSTRGKMLLRVSYDEGTTWPISKRVYDDLTEDQAVAQGKGGYSSLAKTGDNMIGALIEINEDTSSSTTSHRSIDFHKFNLSWILNGASEPSIR